MKISKNWLKERVDFKQSIEEIAEGLTLAGIEVEEVVKRPDIKDTILEVEITSNRPDWLHHCGIAREVSALYGTKFKEVDYLKKATNSFKSNFKISIDEKTLCPFYAGIVIKGVKPIQSPKEIQSKILAMGHQPINLLVDLTNIVLFELGQPMHAFDYDKLQGEMIQVRYAKNNEKFLALDDETYELKKDDLVIADKARAIALAGIKGGRETAVTEATTTILLESAMFQPTQIRKTSRRHLLRSDSSYRFERGVDMEMITKAQQRYLALLKQYGEFEAISQLISAGSNKIKETTVKLRHSEIAALLGSDIPKKSVISILKNLGLKVTAQDSIYSVTIPLFRRDLTRSADLIEELARIYGYDKIPETIPRRVVHHQGYDLGTSQLEKNIREALTANGYYGAIPFNLIDESKIANVVLDNKHFVRIVNPQNKDLALLRPSMFPGLLECVSENIKSDNIDIKLFETGRIYKRKNKKQLPDELKRLGMVASGEITREWYQAGREFSIHDVKGAVDALFKELRITSTYEKEVFPYFDDAQSVAIYSGKRKIGYLGKLKSSLLGNYEIKQDVYGAELDLSLLKELANLQPRFQMISKYPVVKRDIAVIVDEKVTVDALEKTILGESTSLISKIELIDNFKGKHLEAGKKSVAFLMHFSSSEKTLTGDEIQVLYDKIYRALNEQHNAHFREG